MGDRHEVAARRPRSARPGSVVRRQLRRAGRATRRRRWSGSRGFCERRLGRHPRTRPAAVAPHARLARSGEVAAQRRRARPALRPRARGRGAARTACSRHRRRQAVSRRAGRPRPRRRRARRAERGIRAPARRRSRTSSVRQRAHLVVPRASRRRRVVARSCRPTRAAASSWLRADGDGAQHALPALPGADGDGARAGRARGRHQGAGAAVPEPARGRAPGSTRPACTTPASCRASSHATGDIRIHDMAFAGDELWVGQHPLLVPGTLDRDYSFVPRWRPPFVTALAAEDRCHLNGLAMRRRRAALRHRARHHRHRRAAGASDKTTGGVVLDVPSGEVVVQRPVACRTRRAGTTAGCGCSSRATARLGHVDLDTRPLRGGRPSPRVHPRPGLRRPLRVRRPVAGAREPLRGHPAQGRRGASAPAASG